MKILFVCSGNSKTFNIPPFIKSQGETINLTNNKVNFFKIKGKGVLGYITASKKLRNYLKKNNYDIIHAHYTLSGWTAVLAFSKIPIVLSLMGTDTYGEYIAPNRVKFSSRYLTFLTYLIQPFVKAIICKSEHIRSFVWLKKKSYVVPNGIHFEKVQFDKNGFREKNRLLPNKKYVLFLGSKTSNRKNYKVVDKAVQYLDDIEVIAPYPIYHDKVIEYLNSVDVLVVPSLMEGSPNVVKEAMACNLPVVSTNVGDVEWLFGDEPGYFLTSFEPIDIAEKIKKALDFKVIHKHTNGRNRLLELNLDSQSVAKEIIGIYEKVISK